VVLVLACLTAGCGQSATLPTRAPLAGNDLARALLDRRFTVRSLTADTKPVPLDSGHPVTIEVRADLWSIDTTCNGMATAWRVETGQVRLRWDTGMTVMGCSEPAARREHTIVRLVSSRPTVSYDGITLAVDGDGVRMEAQPSAVLPSTTAPAGPPQTLPPGVVSSTEPAVGAYRLDTIIVDGVAEAPPGVVVTLTASGEITVDTGCNQLQARTSLQTDGFHGDFFTTTYRLCDPATARFEQLVLDRLDPFTVREDGTGHLSLASSTLELRASLQS
jgi:heat shock protein HslJ